MDSDIAGMRRPARRRLAVIALIAAGLAAACTPYVGGPGSVAARVKARGAVVVATNAGWRPQSWIGDDGQLTGFDIDVAREIARRLGAPIRFATPEWGLMTGGHWRGRFDMMVGSATPTKARARVVDFAGVYYYSPYVLVVNRDSPYQRAEDLDGRRIGVETGTTSEDYVKRRLQIDDVGAPPVRYLLHPGAIHTYANSLLPFDDLRLPHAARLDAVLAGEQTAEDAIRSGYPIRILAGPKPFKEPLTVITDKDDPAWTAKVRAIVAQMRADGTLRRITIHWYGKDYSQ